MNTKLTPFRLTPEDLIILDACQEHVGVQSRSEAFRAILRSYARAEGLNVSKPSKPKAAKKPKTVTK